MTIKLAHIIDLKEGHSVRISQRLETSNTGSRCSSYVGTLHEISSENSTVALEQVVSWGTEGRRPDDEVAPTPDKVYEYIVFRGSDVKDLRIEKEPEKQQPQVPDDPAILGVSLFTIASLRLPKVTGRSNQKSLEMMKDFRM